MSLNGSGAVVIWHDVEAAAIEDYYAWHGSEHTPERLSIPGFLRGRRFRVVGDGLMFFNLYETETPETTHGAAYQARLNDPTPWTRQVMPHFRGMTRSVCRVERSEGVSEGGLAATWRYDVADAEKHRAAMVALFGAILSLPGVAAAHLLSADLAASGVATIEQKARGVANVTPSWVLVVEGWSEPEAMAALRESALSDAALRTAGAEGPIDYGLYRLQIALDALV